MKIIKLIIIIFILIIGIYLIHKCISRTENFTDYNIKKKLKKAEEVNKLKYKITKKYDIYYFDSKDKKYKVETRTSLDKNKLLYVYNDNTFTGLKGYVKNNTLNFKFDTDKGIIEGNSVYSNTRTRLKTTIKSNKKDINDDTIIGYSGFPGEFNVKNNKMFPIIYEDGGTIISFINDKETNIINMNNEKYMLYLFINYAFIDSITTE